ncbi:MAG: hypothetical protein WCJ70_04620 [bacterium]
MKIIKGIFFKEYKYLSLLIFFIFIAWGVLIPKNQKSSQTSSEDITAITTPSVIISIKPTNIPEISTPTPDVDKTPPEVFTFEGGVPPTCTDQLIGLEKNRGIVSVGTGYWEGSGEVLSVPIIGCVFGDVKRIQVDEKDVYWNESGEIYTRLKLNVLLGLNRYRTEITDSAGNKTIKYLDVTSKRVNPNKIDVDLKQ